MLAYTRFAIPALLLASLAAGCANTHDAATADPIGSAAAAVQGEPGQGFVGRVKAALGTINLTADQTTKLDVVESTLKSQTAPVRAAREALANAVADQVAKGAIDEAALAAPIATLTQAATAAKPAIQTAANALYATLTPAQREQFVAAVKPHGDHFGRHADAHAGRHDHGHFGHGPLKKLAEDLKLSGDQMLSIRSAMKAQLGDHRGEAGERFKEGKQRMEALAQAFVGPSFDAAALDVGSGLAHFAAEGPGHMVKMLGVALPILTPDQRQQLAAHIRTKAATFAED